MRYIRLSNKNPSHVPPMSLPRPSHVPPTSPRAAHSLQIVLVGNKLDIAGAERKVPAAEGSRFAENLGVPFFEVSAKSGINVTNAFETLVDGIVVKWNKARPEALRGQGMHWGWGGNEAKSNRTHCGFSWELFRVVLNVES